MQTVVFDSYRVSQRVVLNVGDKFRVAGGPYFLVRDAAGKRTKMSMAAKGPFTFVSYNKRGRREWLVAYGFKEGGFAVLALTRWKTVDLPNFVTRPYRVIGKKRTPKKDKT